MYAEVVVEFKKIDKTFTYKIPDSLTVRVGMRVCVPFGKNTLEGFVIFIHDNTPSYLTKEIISLVDVNPVLNEEMIELGKYISKKTLCSLTSAYQTMLPKALKAKNGFKINVKYECYLEINNDGNFDGKKKEVYDFVKKNKRVLKKDCVSISNYAVSKLINEGYLKEVKIEVNRLQNNYTKEYKSIILNDEQQNAVNLITSFDSFKPFLLHGVTGSGKTEVYMNIIDEVLKRKKEVIVLVPEISLTPQLTSIFKSRFKGNIAILHSRLSDGERYDEWRKIEKKEVSIVVGARSAIFAPFTNIGLIVIDEEHSSTYHQENVPTYNAIDIALKRGKTHNAMVVLGSATPSIESYTRAKLNIYTLVELKSRVNKQMPIIKLVDMCNEFKKGNRIISDELKEKINDRLKNNEQVIILLNRRGYTTSLVCHECSEAVKCPNCDIPLVLHKSSNKLKCHYCNFEKNVINTCLKCGSKDLKSYGFGTEKLEEVINNMFDCKTIRMDVDTTSLKGAHEKIISAFENHEYDILIGTQMIAKGLDFKDVTLVGVINGDAGLNIPDFRSGERTFQLLNQVSGRSGRSLKKGEVIIQGFNIDHYSIRLASINDYKSFYEYEMKSRKELNYPPYCDILLIKIMDKDIDKCFKEAEKIVKFLSCDGITILGPSSALIPKVNNIYTVQIIVKYKEYKLIADNVMFINNTYKNNKIRVIFEFNPIRL